MYSLCYLKVTQKVGAFEKLLFPCGILSKIFLGGVGILNGVAQLSIFCALCQKYQHFFSKENMIILKQIIWETEKLH